MKLNNGFEQELCYIDLFQYDEIIENEKRANAVKQTNELNELREIYLNYELQLKILEGMINELDSEIKDLGRKIIDFEKDSLPRLVKFHEYINF